MVCDQTLENCNSIISVYEIVIDNAQGVRTEQNIKLIQQEDN